VPKRIDGPDSEICEEIREEIREEIGTAFSGEPEETGTPKTTTPTA
jgi:hypothetical protein